MSFPNLIAASLLLLVVASGLHIAAATSCGEPRLSASDRCSDWQCSRIVYPPTDNANNGSDYFGYGLCVRGLGEGSICGVDDDCFVKKYVCRNISFASTIVVNGTAVNVSSWGNRCVKADDSKVAWQGYVGVAVAVVGFGTNFVPAKKVRAGNGMLFQLAQAMGIIVTGVTTALVTQTYTLYPMSLVGGLLWTLGNSLRVPVIQLVGLGIGMSMWGTTNMLVGWASGRFGWMGVSEEIAPTPWRSYVGVGVAVLAICAFASVKPTTTGKKVAKKECPDGSPLRETIPLNSDRDAYGHNYTPIAGAPAAAALNGDDAIRRRADHPYAADEELRRHHDALEKEQRDSAGSRRVLGIVLSIAAGILFGFNFNPSQAMMDHYDQRTLDDPSSTPSLHFTPMGVDYFFSFSMGVALTSIGITVLFYAAHTMLPQSVVKRALPKLFNDMHLLNFGEMLAPGVLSGIIWACAQLGWFVANTNLGLAVSFPLIGVGPSLVANAWGILLFGEVEGRRNFLLLGLAFMLVGISCGFTVWAQSS